MNIHKSDLLRIRNDKGQTIAGILERNLPNESTRGAKIGIICHGIQAHKDYSFQPKLAKALPFDTFRFDFRGYGESDYFSIDYGNKECDVEDIDTVVRHLEREYGYQLYTIISHSAGNISSYRYAAKIRNDIPHLVAISAKYNFNQVLKTYPKVYLEKFKNDGFIIDEYKYQGQFKRVMTTFESFSNFASFDMSFVRDLPESTSVFIIHGSNDEYTSPDDAAMFSNIIPNNTLKIIMSANHSYSRHIDELISSIAEYFSNEFQSTKFFERYKFITKMPRYFEGIVNFRDLGGYPSSVKAEDLMQRYARKRFIFRSGNLIGITENGVKTLNFLNIQNVFDFRTTFEVQKIGFANILGIDRIHISVFKDIDHSREALLEKWTLYVKDYNDLSNVFMTILEEGISAYKVVFQHILNYPNRPFIIHGAVGNNRTGIFCMLVLKLCGVNDDIIAREYEITGRSIHYEKVMVKTYYDMCEGHFTVDEIRKIMSSKFESMVLALRKFSDIYGTVENYLSKYLGFNRLEIDQIKSNLMNDWTSDYNGDNKSHLKSVL